MHQEVWALYEAAEGLVQELSGHHLDLAATDHPALEYLAGPGLNALNEAAVEIMRDFHENIIPLAEAN